MDNYLRIAYVIATDLFCHVMQGICHLLTNIGIYCKEAISSCSSYELRRLDDSGNDLESLSEYENMDLNLVFKKINEMEARKRATERVSFHLHLPRELSAMVEGTFLLKSMFLCLYVITICCLRRKLMVAFAMMVGFSCNFSLAYC